MPCPLLLFSGCITWRVLKIYNSCIRNMTICVIVLTVVYVDFFLLLFHLFSINTEQVNVLVSQTNLSMMCIVVSFTFSLFVQFSHFSNTWCVRLRLFFFLMAWPGRGWGFWILGLKISVFHVERQVIIC